MSLTESSDAHLVMETLTGNREAFGQIVARYQTLICSLAYSATGNLDQSQDVAQETFLAAWKQIASLREPAKLRSWLCTIARNLTFDSLKKQGREPSHGAESEETLGNSAAPEPLPCDLAINQEEAAILWRSLDRIPDLYREPLILFYRQHQSIETVARDLELTEDAVKQRLARGRKLLQEQVLAFVEGALGRTTPGKTFTLAVMAALPALTYSAKAATLGAAVTTGAAAKSTGAVAVGSFILAPLLMIFGNYLGYRLSLDSAKSDEERTQVRSLFKMILSFTLAVFAGFAGFVLWVCRNQTEWLPRLCYLFSGLVVIYILSLLGFAAVTENKRRRILAGVMAREGSNLAAAPVWEYRSKIELFGLPLVHIRLGDRSASIRESVKAWIAVGDYALGGLIAFGGVAIAPFSMGGVAIGLCGFGGVAVGLLALGALGLGGWAYGGVVIGWQAFGGCAIAWNAAWGAVAIAQQYALGEAARALEANTAIAEQFMRPQIFFRAALTMVRYSMILNLLWVVPLFLQWRVVARRRSERPAT